MPPNYLWSQAAASDMSSEVYHSNEDQNSTLHNISTKRKVEALGWKQWKK